MASLQEVADRAVELLNAFPPTADEVAEFLEAEGIKGLPSAAHSCPVSKFLHKELDGWSFSWCGDLLIQDPAKVGDYRKVEDEDEVSVWRTPSNPAAELFMRAFDDHAYPQLVA